MTDDIFSENVQTESNRMSIDGGEAPGSGVTLTTSSEDLFSFSDRPPNATEMHVHLGRGCQRRHGTRPDAGRTAHVLSSCRRSGMSRANRMYG